MDIKRTLRGLQHVYYHRALLYTLNSSSGAITYTYRAVQYMSNQPVQHVVRGTKCCPRQHENIVTHGIILSYRARDVYMVSVGSYYKYVRTCCVVIPRSNPSCLSQKTSKMYLVPASLPPSLLETTCPLFTQNRVIVLLSRRPRCERYPQTNQKHVDISTAAEREPPSREQPRYKNPRKY